MTLPPKTPAGLHRPEIDGLRAIAVVAVILFHARVTGFEGGFLGVDVFFVISGFLIAGLILQEMETGSFNLAAFYARRARRILPALFVMLLAVTVPAIMLLSSDQRTDFLRTLASAAWFGSNIWMAFTSGYFDGPAAERPLLHTWSLGVEEQYYLVFPLAFVALWRFGRRRLAWALSAAALASFAFGEYGSRHFPTANFFLAPGRVWELLLGALGALAFARRDGMALWPGGKARQMLAGGGLLAVLLGIYLADASTPSPSWHCLLPAGGTLALLMFAERGTLTAKLLSLRAFTGIGLVSYSAYLWHQPLLVFGRLQGFGTKGLELALLVAATFAIAAISWRWIEQPVRRAHGWAPPRALVAAMASSAVMGTAGLAAAHFLPAGVPDSVLRSFALPLRQQECFDLVEDSSKAQGWYCSINPGAQARPSFIVYGDSHAMQMLPAFERAAAAAGRSGVFAGRSGCAPLLGTIPLTHLAHLKVRCKTLGDRIFPFARENGLQDAFLIAKWSYYTHIMPGSDYLNALGFKTGEPKTVEHSRAVLVQGALNTAEAAREAGVRLHVVTQMPVQLRQPGRIYEEAWSLGGDVDGHLRALSMPRPLHDERQAVSTQTWRRTPGVNVLTFDDLLCDALVCPVGTASRNLYQDMSHLNADGANLLAPPLTRLLGGPQSAKSSPAPLGGVTPR